MSEFHFLVHGKEITIEIESASDEWKICDPVHSDKKVYVDCCFNLDPDYKYYGNIGSPIGIEVTDTSKTSRTKINILKRSGFFILEIEMLADWHIPNGTKVSSSDIDFLKRRINGYLSKRPTLKALTPPAIFI
ncbi:hypothetical protein LA52FAK_41120 [Desulforhopalus sp. 52FAK]